MKEIRFSVYSIGNNRCLPVFHWTVCTAGIHAAFHRICFGRIYRLASNLECESFPTHATNGGDQCDQWNYHSGRTFTDHR